MINSLTIQDPLVMRCLFFFRKNLHLDGVELFLEVDVSVCVCVCVCVETLSVRCRVGTR
jgi:hypothetical protein